MYNYKGKKSSNSTKKENANNKQYAVLERVQKAYDLQDYVDTISILNNLKHEIAAIGNVYINLVAFGVYECSSIDRKEHMRSRLFEELRYRLIYEKEEMNYFKIYKLFEILPDGGHLTRFVSFRSIYERIINLLSSYHATDITDEIDDCINHMLLSLSDIFLNECGSGKVFEMLVEGNIPDTHSYINSRLEVLDFIIKILSEEACNHGSLKESNKKSKSFYFKDLL